MWRTFKAAFRMAAIRQVLLGLIVVLFVSAVMSAQVTDRGEFASSELHEGVMDRWGAPIVQPAPSVRYVPSGTVFNDLTPMPLDKQQVVIDAQMNYRRRGLVYFSGFDFTFTGDYEVENRELSPVDLVFIFPINVPKNQVLLSDLSFSVNGVSAPAGLSGEEGRLVWTGRARPGERLHYRIAFRGRGLNSLVYALDPAQRVNGFDLRIHVAGGENYDYPAGVVPAHSVKTDEQSAELAWHFASLEAGVPVGLILPSEKAFDSIIDIMARRAWAPFIPFLLGTLCLGLFFVRPFKAWQALLLSAWYALFFVLLPYLTAFMNFYLAYALSLALVASLHAFYVRATVSPKAMPLALGLSAAFVALPTTAVILQGYTGLIYTLEIAAGLAALMVFTTRDAFRRLVEQILALLAPAQGANNVR